MQYQVMNPATGQVEREYPAATDAEIETALKSLSQGGNK